MTETLPSHDNGNDTDNDDQGDRRRTVQPDTNLFSQPPDVEALAQHRPVVDNSETAMDRLRTPFEVDPAAANRS
jgi:hypothetical protein